MTLIHIFPIVKCLIVLAGNYLICFNQNFPQPAPFTLHRGGTLSITTSSLSSAMIGWDGHVAAWVTSSPRTTLPSDWWIQVSHDQTGSELSVRGATQSGKVLSRELKNCQKFLFQQGGWPPPPYQTPEEGVWWVIVLGYPANIAHNIGSWDRF